MNKVNRILPLKEIYDTLGVPLDMLAYRGSIAHDLYVPKDDPNCIDDIDLIGFCVAPANYYLGLSDWGSRGTKDFWVGEYDIVVYEYRKAFSLFLQGNPNIISTLWQDDELIHQPHWRQVKERRSLFVGKHVYNAFAGYASGQLQKMESRDPQELRLYIAVTQELKYRGKHPNKETLERPAETPVGEALDVTFWDDQKLRAALTSFQKKGENLGYMGEKRKGLVLEHGYDCKNASHCIRLLKMCREFLETGEIFIKRTADRQELLDIKAGRWSLADIKTYAETMFQENRVARDKSSLPEGPDKAKAEALLVDILKAGLLG